jgi:DNA-binding response OmpR family regulator
MSAHVLLIEDDPDLREAVQLHMLRRGYHVTACASIADANEVMAHIHDEAIAPDTILADINLPDGDGVEFCREQSRRFPNMVCVLMTGDPALVETLLPANDSPVRAIVCKPVSLNTFDSYITRRGVKPAA